jgi:hypothetical protein
MHHMRLHDLLRPWNAYNRTLTPFFGLKDDQKATGYINYHPGEWDKPG